MNNVPWAPLSAVPADTYGYGILPLSLGRGVTFVLVVIPSRFGKNESRTAYLDRVIRR